MLALFSNAKIIFHHTPLAYIRTAVAYDLLLHAALLEVHLLLRLLFWENEIDTGGLGADYS